MAIEITETNGRFEARFPYDPNAITFVKQLGMRWDPAKKCWWTKDKSAADATAGGDALESFNQAKLAAATAERERISASVEASRAVDADIEIPSPQGLNYLGYQKGGIAYAMKRDSALIADEMGLGKTIQAIGVANADPEARKILIICPASLKLNWQREWRKWDVKGLTIGIANGKWPSGLDLADVVIINYENVGKHREKIDAISWDLMIVDECHYAKNPNAERTLSILGGSRKRKMKSVPENRACVTYAVKRQPLSPSQPFEIEERWTTIKARRRVFLTGTPVVNRPVELWPLVQALDPQGLGKSFFPFAKRYCNAHNNGYGWDFSGSSNLDDLQEKLRGAFMVRRLKADVLKELPPKRRQIVPITSPEIEKAVGREGAAMKRFEEMRDELDMLTALALVDSTYQKRVDELQDETGAAFEDISKIRHETALAKVPALIDFISDALESIECVVVMVHHQDVAEQIRNAFAEIGSVMVHGNVALEDRQAAVDDFQAGRARVFVGTIRAAGVGLTLTRSSTVIFGELDFVPGNVSQAEDRCHRIGQTDSVLVQHVVADGSIDARMAQILVDKQAVIDAALDTIHNTNTVAPVAIDHSLANAAIEGTDAAERQRKEALERKRIMAEEFEERRYEARFSAAYGLRAENLDRVAPLLTDDQIAATHAALRMLNDANWDNATERNGVGFNQADTGIGRVLARRESLNAKEAALGAHIVRKYHRQYAPTLFERIFPK